MHRPACGGYVDETLIIQAQPLTAEEQTLYAAHFPRLVVQMARLEEDGSIVNERELPPGVYTKAEYDQVSKTAGVLLS